MHTADVTFDELSSALRDAHSEVAAAEAHGIICGAVCAPTGTPDRWQPLIVGAPESDGNTVAELLNSVYRQTHASLDEESFGFALLIPDDSCALPERIEGLADWCRGFVLGLAAGGVEDIRRLPGDAPEVVSDFAAIAEMSADGESEDLQQERALAEIEEYVRVGVQVIYEELHPGTSRQ